MPLFTIIRVNGVGLLHVHVYHHNGLSTAKSGGGYQDLPATSDNKPRDRGKPPYPSQKGEVNLLRSKPGGSNVRLGFARSPRVIRPPPLRDGFHSPICPDRPDLRRIGAVLCRSGASFAFLFAFRSATMSFLGIRNRLAGRSVS